MRLSECVAVHILPLHLYLLKSAESKWFPSSCAMCVLVPVFWTQIQPGSSFNEGDAIMLTSHTIWLLHEAN